jgi:hypothetical protein
MGSRISAARPLSPSPFRRGGRPDGLDELRVVIVGRAQLELLGAFVILDHSGAGGTLYAGCARFSGS